MQRYLDVESRQIVYCRNVATSTFWDGHWKETDLPKTHAAPRNRLVHSVTRRYLKPGATILEGGCGPATTVAVLDRAGHHAVGLDFAVGTLRDVHAVAPQLRLAAGDVFRLPFADKAFDGYWSLGVIEHFHGGYAGILAEAARILRPGGFLFLTFPWMSPLRRKKADRGCYPPLPVDFEPLRDGFYQFALNAETVSEALLHTGFSIVSRRGIDALKGIKDECSPNGVLSGLYNSPGLLPKGLRLALNTTLGNLVGHALLMVARRKHN